VIAEATVWLPWVFWAAVLILATRLDGLYCGLETGIYVMNKNRLELHAEANVPAARELQRMLRNPNNLLAVLLIGANLTRYLATFAVSAMFVLAGHEARAEWYTLAVAAPLLFVASDSVPKGVFQRLGPEAVYRRVRLLRLSDIAFRITGISPLVIVVSALMMKLTRAGRRAGGALGHEGVAAVVAEGHASGAITHFQSVMADRVMNIGDVTVEDVMIPMRQVAAVPVGASRDAILDAVRARNYSRMPVVDSRNTVVGILNAYELLIAEPDKGAERFTTGPVVLKAQQTVTQALYQLRQARGPMGVVERDGTHVGIVTIKDLVEEIVGEIEDW